MKIKYTLLFTYLMLIPVNLICQEVRTLATIEANGGISVRPNGDIFVAHFGPLPPNPNIGKSIYKVTTNGDVSTFLDGALQVGTGNYWDSNGFLYQANLVSGKIFKIDTTGSIVSSDVASLNSPVGIVTDKFNGLYICDCSANNVVKIFASGVQETFVSSNLFQCANGITIDEDRNLYVTNFNDSNILKISPQKIITVLGSIPGGFGNGHITYRKLDKKLYIASYAGNRIYSMDLQGEVELFAGGASAGNINAINPLQATFNHPNGIEFSPDECSLYITQDNFLREIKMVDSACLNANQTQNIYEEDLQIYPNPARNEIHIKNPDYVGNRFVIYDYSGRQRVIDELNPNGIIDISSLHDGIYYLVFYTANGQIITKRLTVIL